MTPKLGALAALLLTGLLVANVVPAPPASVAYAASATVVVKPAGQAALLDDGGVVCDSAGPSIGGGCLPFGAPGVRVTDDVLGSAVAFQVCVDNNGDGVCSGEGGACGDQIFFSHNDNGTFFNPLGPLPTGFRPGCPGGAWNGYVVFLCAGVHIPREAGTPLPLPGGVPHTHEATKGTIAGSASGTGFGNFCQPSGFQAKQYVVV